jgi:hypothetical protein
VATKNTKSLAADVLSLSKEIERLTAELSKLKKGTESYKQVNNQLSKSIAEGVKASEQLRDRTLKLSSANKSHEASIKAANQAQQQLNQSLKSASSTQGSGKGFIDSFVGSFTPQKLGSTLGTITRFLGIGTALAATFETVKQVTIESVKTFISLEQQFASLSAISGATADQMKVVQENTFEVASSTGYAVGEVIQLQSSLVKLGVPLMEASGSIKIIAIAARAMGEDLSSVGEALFKVSNQFSLTQSELASTAATLVSSINESALSFQEFGTAIQYVGPIANQVGLTFRETAGYMEILSNSGFRASKIGTGLRDLFIDLKVPGEELSDTILRLSKQNISLSEAVDLVGKTSAAQLLVLLRNADAIEKLSSETYDANEAIEDMSMLLLQNAKNMATTQGRISAISTAWENYKNRIGQAIVSTELFIDLLDVLDKKAGATARGYNIISKLQEDQLEAISKRFASAGAYDRAKISFDLLSKEDQKTLENMYINSTSTAEKKTMSFRNYLKEITLGNRSLANDASKALKGVNDRLMDVKKGIDDQAKIEKAKQEQSSKFQKDYLALEKQTGDLQLKNADALLDRLAEETELLNAQIEKDPRNDVLKARLAETENYTNRVSELIAQSEDKKDASDKANREKARIEKENQEAEIKRLKTLIELRASALEDQKLALFLELEIAKSKNDVLRVSELENEIIENKAKAYSELLTEIGKAKYLTEEQKVLLTGQISQFDTTKADVFSGAKSIASSFQEAAKDMSIVDATALGVSLIEKIITGFEKASGALPPDEKDRLTKALQTLLFNPKITPEDSGQDAAIEKRKQEIEEAIKSLSSITSAFADGISELNDVAFENLKNRLDAEKNAIKERYDYEEKILESQVENQLITQEEYERKLEGIQKRRIQKENQVNKKIFEAEKKRDRQNAALQLTETLASIVLNNYKKFDSITASAASIVAAVAASAQYGLKVSAINQREFVPVRFAEGGVVNGPSHAEGGVPFTVQGRGGYEMEGGEFIVNKEATKRNYSLLRQINDSVKPSSYSSGRIFAAGGIVKAEELGIRQLQLLETIAMATGTTSINTSKPVRAFVSADDLRKSDVDLRIKERNSNL